MYGEELEYIAEAYNTNWMSTVGANINEVERLTNEYVGCKYSVALSAGTAATVEHDCFVGDYVHTLLGSHIAGTVEIGKSGWIGIGASVINNAAICKQCVIGSGSVVVENLIESGTYI